MKIEKISQKKRGVTLSFEKFGLSPELLSGLADVRIEKPTPLQEKVLPLVLEGKHVLVETHANDDLAFLIPALQKITEIGEVNGTQVLILTPSIERAEKIDEQIWALGYHAQINSALMALKGDKAEQEEALLDGAPVIVANPGRCIEILDKNNFRLKDIKLIVIDEAHEMQQYNLVNRVTDILRFVDCEPQIVILSRQQNSATKQLAELALKNPELIGFEAEKASESDQSEVETSKEEVEIDLEHAEKKLEKASISVVLKKDLSENSTEQSEEEETAPDPLPKNLEQGYIKVPPRMKISTLMAHLEQSSAKKVVVFSASSRTSDRLFRIIKKKSWGVVSLGDDLDETAYKERYERFKKYEMRVLLIGGLSANSVELEAFDEVINYDVPSELDEYRFRAELIGNGKATQMISLVSKMDQDDIERISKEAGYPPVELPFPEEMVEKKKKTNAPKQARPPRKKSSGRSSNPRNAKRAPKKIKKKESSPSLPRPTYDGLSGGRDGNESSGSGVIGWVKKLFS